MALKDQLPMTMVSPGPNLLDLATELLLMMFELLDEDDLFRLSLSSTRLHYVALEFYLSRQPGSYSKTHVLIVGPPFTMLPALRMALFVQDLPKVSVMFMTGPVIQGMRGLERLIRRISSVGEFSIECTHVERESMEQPEVREAAGGLLAALAGKECVDLTIRGGYYGNPKDLTNERPKSTKITSSQFPRDLPPLTTLNRFNIYSSFISTPTLRTWAINSVNLSPITNLKLHDVTFSDKHVPMGKIFRFLTLPLLSHLSIASDNLIFSDLVEFLCRHPRIENLSMATGTAIVSNSPFPAGALPLLSTLKAPPHYLCHILASSDTLPALKVVVVDPDFPFMFCHEQSAVDQRLEDIEECFMHLALRESVAALRLALPAGSWAANWLERGSHPKDGERRDVERSLVHVTVLDVDVWGCASFSTAMEPLLVRWLALFPSLRHVTFDSFTFIRMTSDEHSAFAKVIGEACSRVEIVEIRYKKYFFAR